MPSRFAPSCGGCNGENDASAGELVNSLLSSYGALPGGSNPLCWECEAAINYNTPFCITFRGAEALQLFLARGAHMGNEPGVGSLVMLVIAASFAE